MYLSSKLRQTGFDNIKFNIAVLSWSYDQRYDFAVQMLEYQRGDTKPCGRSSYGIAAVEFHTERIEIIPPIFVVSFTLFSPLNINGHMLSGVMAQEVTTAYNTRVLTLFYCLQISSIVFSYTSILSRMPSLCLSPCFYPSPRLSPPSPPPPFPSSACPPLSPLLFYHRLSFSYRSPYSPFLSCLRFSSSFSSLLFSPHPCPIPIFFSFFALCISPSVPRCTRPHYVHRDAHYFPFVSSRFLHANFFVRDKRINLECISRL